MDDSTRQALKSRKDSLLAENRRLQHQIDEASNAAVSDPGFSPSSNTLADRRAEMLFRQQSEIVSQVYDIDRQLTDR